MPESTKRQLLDYIARIKRVTGVILILDLSEHDANMHAGAECGEDWIKKDFFSTKFFSLLKTSSFFSPFIASSLIRMSST